MEFKAQLLEYAQWREKISQAIKMYRDWCERYQSDDTQSKEAILNILSVLSSERITLAFAAEYSRGKTELINALFFAEMGVNLLPSSSGSENMCSVELFYEPGACCVRLLDIDTRLEKPSLLEYKKNLQNWTQIELDFSAPAQIQEALKVLFAVKKVSREHAAELGLWNEIDAGKAGLLDVEELDIPCWRYALISLPHPILKQGLCILDTPGLTGLDIEPELTLNLLPSAEAIVFVFAADKGITEQDLEFWGKYINQVIRHKKLEFAVVMNKIDKLYPALQDEADFSALLDSEINKAADALAFDKQLILPVSAQQALTAKIKSDPVLLAKSRLDALELYLSDNVLSKHSKSLKQKIANSLLHLITASACLSEAQYKQALAQLDEFKKIDCDNTDMIKKMMVEIQDRQKIYLRSIENFKNSRRVFLLQAKALMDALSKEKIDTVIKQHKDGLTQSRTTYGLKQSIQLLFEDLHDILQTAVLTANKTTILVASIHKSFGADYGLQDIEHKVFSIQKYQFQLEQILEEGEQFRSSTRITMMEQTVVVKQLYNSIIARIRGVFEEAHYDAQQWVNGVFMPLKQQIKEHKKQIDSRLHMLGKINDSKEGDAENITQLENKLVPLKRQLTELQVIFKALN